jgi:hypothetical protein
MEEPILVKPPHLTKLLRTVFFSVLAFRRIWSGKTVQRHRTLEANTTLEASNSTFGSNARLLM